MADTGGHFDFFKEVFEFLFFLYVPILFKGYVVSNLYQERSKDELSHYSVAQVMAMTDEELMEKCGEKVKMEKKKKFTFC